jgi:hypothetical protein
VGRFGPLPCTNSQSHGAGYIDRAFNLAGANAAEAVDSTLVDFLSLVTCVHRPSVGEPESLNLSAFLY